MTPPIAAMVGVSVVSWLAATLIARAPVNPELWLGMAGPLASAVITWIVTARTYRSDPARVTGVMVAGFAARMAFVAIYMTVMLRVVSVRPIPFVIGFASYLIGLYVFEALLLKRLFAGGMRSSSGA
jgi:hypothetical protein